MQIRRLLTLAVAALALIPAAHAADQGSAKAATSDPALVAVVAGDWRTPEAKARDAYRRPVEALTFWGLKPGMSILEVQPGAASWWTDILAPYARRTGGKFYVTGADLGNPDRTAWAAATRSYLLAHPEVNVVIWSWCGQVSTATPADIDTYLALMDSLERAFPAVSFVYMTGHLDGTGLEGNLHKRNQQIRSYCATHNKRLFDFADIETWTPDGLYMGDRKPTDNCDYDSNGDGTLDRNWATEWQNTHPDQWYQCSSAHSQPLNANRKAYAAWWLWARLAGWNGISN